MIGPILTVIAGPNGAGKSTIYKIVEPLGRFINADDIESALPAHLSKADREKAAARAALDAIRDLLSNKRSLVVETTLSGNWPIRLMREAKALGYRVELVFIVLDSPQRSIERVAFRVRDGGHDIPVDVLLRRYPRSLANLPAAAELADETAIIDNSAKKPRWVMKFEGGKLVDLDIRTPLDETLLTTLHRD
ncbi:MULTISPECIES: zeta toxin family protein [unclassified Rhizobium]|uniref:zeta toxin family protein n=1 Tax=unclassified Rhizobium TaxID=2613769 RepID=UPI0007EB0CE9|nr:MULTISPECIES: zeta toxin family protein [unclassified Rhizobium]ANL11973.1 P-loop NTPase domain-containing protein [Rhizobium sp. N1341]ANM42818.1 P-loop NTPase domain-containing protein [Rhizobium sp. N741]